MPIEAKVAIFEDDPCAQEEYEKSLRKEGHSIVITGKTREEALEALGRFKELGVQVLVLDGNLLGGAKGEDAQAILAALAETKLDVKTVGMSAGVIKGVDADVGKMRIRALGKIVTEI